MKKKLFLSALALAATLCDANALTNEMTVQANKPGAQVQSTMYGIFFEDINYAADGGLYAEMVKNRSFEFPQNLMGWRTFGNVQLKDDGPFDKNPHYVRLSYAGHAHKHTGIENEGFFGVATKKDAAYRFSVWARCPEGGKSVLQVQFVDNATMGENQCYSEGFVEVEGKEWKKYTLEIVAKKTMPKASLRIFLRAPKGKGINTTDLEHVSLFPKDTWKGRENGMRKDLAQALADLKPGVFRFPGGCIVEGTDLETRYQWKNTVGPVENRPLNENRWEYTFAHRFYPDYFQSYGLGFFEYFQLCEDFGCEPLPVLSCGLSCQYQNDIRDEKKVHVALEDLDSYIQDAVDLIEFANGSVETKWGKVRADMGHPEPFNLKFLGIGNEQWDYKDNPAFTARLKKFLDVLKKKHPEIKYIGTTGPDSEGDKFELLQPRMKELKVDLYDEHFYRNEAWFLDSKNRHRYDNYDRKGPKVFAGEYACHGRGKKWNHFNAALLEAAFMTGIERNADVVSMATYAPLFAHVEGWQWRPDMIWFDNLRSFKSCSYYVQQLYGLYKGTNVLPLRMNGKVVAGDEDQNGLFASSVVDKATGDIYIKVVNISKESQPVKVTLKGVKKVASAKVVTLSSTDPVAENTLDNPNKIMPKEQPVQMSANILETNVPASTFAVYVVTPVKK
ncbi:MAG: alpha-L-arabinofuranosidase C-terminal domain-containing protein [Prevotellaceae bacterium]|nr:alpha-L-arabinofuranosidase C-terminal domain-containing protein [Prevotellaceae bacterium]